MLSMAWNVRLLSRPSRAKIRLMAHQRWLRMVKFSKTKLRTLCNSIVLFHMMWGLPSFKEVDSVNPLGVPPSITAVPTPRMTMFSCSPSDDVPSAVYTLALRNTLSIEPSSWRIRQLSNTISIFEGSSTARSTRHSACPVRALTRGITTLRTPLCTAKSTAFWIAWLSLELLHTASLGLINGLYIPYPSYSASLQRKPSCFPAISARYPYG